MAWLVNALLEVIKDLVYGAFVLITKWFTGTLTLSTGEFHDIFNKGEEMNLLDLLVDDVIGPLAVAGVIGTWHISCTVPCLQRRYRGQ